MSGLGKGHIFVLGYQLTIKLIHKLREDINNLKRIKDELTEIRLPVDTQAHPGITDNLKLREEKLEVKLMSFKINIT